MKDLYLKSLVDGAYAIQKVRVTHGNRIFQQVRHKLGITSSEPTENLEKEKNKLLKTIQSEYKLIADGIKELKNNYQKVSDYLAHRDGIFSEFSEIFISYFFDLYIFF